MRKLRSPYSLSIFLGRAAENNVGQEARVHDMRTMRSPYDQSCNLGGPASKIVGPEDRVHCPRHEGNVELL